LNLIISSHILEHLREPLVYLKEIKTLLNENGYIFIEVPNQDDAFKEYLEAHLIVFNEKSLRTLVKGIGMQIVDIRSVGRNIKNLKTHKNIGQILKKTIKKYFPQLVLIKKVMEQKNINGNLTKKRDARDNVDYKLNEYDNNGQWLRLIIKN